MDENNVDKFDQAVGRRGERVERVGGRETDAICGPLSLQPVGQTLLPRNRMRRQEVQPKCVLFQALTSKWTRACQRIRHSSDHKYLSYYLFPRYSHELFTYVQNGRAYWSKSDSCSPARARVCVCAMRIRSWSSLVTREEERERVELCPAFRLNSLWR